MTKKWSQNGHTFSIFIYRKICDQKSVTKWSHFYSISIYRKSVTKKRSQNGHIFILYQYIEKSMFPKNGHKMVTFFHISVYRIFHICICENFFFLKFFYFFPYRNIEYSISDICNIFFSIYGIWKNNCPHKTFFHFFDIFFNKIYLYKSLKKKWSQII